MKSKPNFQEMSKKEPRIYVLYHCDDEEAFPTYLDKIRAQENRVKYPSLKSLED